MVSHEQVIDNYFNSSVRNHYNKGSRVFFENDTLYSYGHHFILCQKVKNGYIINGDKYSVRYSVSTAKHQHQVISKSKESPQIPFSALYKMLETSKHITGSYDLFSQFKNIYIIDRTNDTYETKYRMDEKTGEKIEYYEHHLGASLIRYKNKYFLSSIDSGSKRYSYFLVELPKKCLTVSEAFRCLANKLNDDEYNKYLNGEIKRQGEYFLIPTDIKLKDKKDIKKIEQISFINRNINKIYLLDNDIREKLKSIEQDFDNTIEDWDKKHHLFNRIKIIKSNSKEYAIEFNQYVEKIELPKTYKIKQIKGKYVLISYSDKVIKNFDLSQGVGNSHIATETIKDKDNNIYIRGTLRHREHKMITLKDVWHKVIKNSAIRSFTATGRVD